MKCGDAVLIWLPNKPKSFWMLGMVKEVLVGFNNIIRLGQIK